MSMTTSVVIRNGIITAVPAPAETLSRPRMMTIADLPSLRGTSSIESMRELNEEIEAHNKVLEKNYELAAELIRVKIELEQTKTFCDDVVSRYEGLLKEKMDRLERREREAKEQENSTFGWIKKKLSRQ